MMSLLINDDAILGGVANLEVTDVDNHVCLLVLCYILL